MSYLAWTLIRWWSASSNKKRVLADLHQVAQAMTCDHGRETVVRTREAPNRRRKADRIALTGEISGGNPSGVVPRLNRRPYGRGHGAQEHGDSGGDGRGVYVLEGTNKGEMHTVDRSYLVKCGE